MDRAAVKLETLNLAFFENLQIAYSTQLKYFVCGDRPADYTYALCYENGTHLHFLWTAKKSERDTQNTYLNQLQAMIAYAIKRKITYLHTGQTAYYPKMRMGSKPEERFILFKSLNGFLHPLLRMGRNIIFPPFPLERIQPFKDEK